MDSAGSAAFPATELLGLSPDARLLIVNCDDFGMYHAVNAAVIESIENGIATSCSLMVPCPWARHAMHLLRERPEIPFGIHLTLFCDTTHYGWGPLTLKQRVPTLLTPTGDFFTPGQVQELLAQARHQEVEREFRAQIHAVLDAGLSPTHLDWHCLGGASDEIVELTMALAREYGLAMRGTTEPVQASMRRRGLPTLDHDIIDSFNLAIAGKATRYAEMIRRLPAGLTELAVHPGLGDAEAQAIDPDGWLVRRTDYDFLTSPEARELLRQTDVTAIDYQPLQQAWSRPAGRRRGALPERPRRGRAPATQATATQPAGGGVSRPG